MKKIMEKIIEIITNILFLVVSYVACGVIICILWNFVVPSVFGLPEINLLQSIALYVLIAILINPPKSEVNVNVE